MLNTIKTIKELNLTDSFLFAKVMADTETCRRILESILGVSIQDISMPARGQPIPTITEMSSGETYP